MGFEDYHFRVDGPGPVFGEAETAGAMRMTALAGVGAAPLEGRAATVNVLRGGGRALGLAMEAEDFLYVPPGLADELPYETEGLLLLTLYAPAGDGPEVARGPLLVPRGAANGYVRVQYRGSDHGRSPEYARFNPQGITYTDKVWWTSRDVLSQELAMPPGAVVPAHVHDRLGLPPDGSAAWQAYYVWEGSARVEIGRSPEAIATVKLAPGDVLVYPNGVAHKVVAGDAGARYIFLEKKARGETGNRALEEEQDYERRLTSRLDMDLAVFIALEAQRSRLEKRGGAG